MGFYVVNYKLRRRESCVWAYHKGGIFPALNRKGQKHHRWGCLVWDQSPCGAFKADTEARGVTASRSWERDRDTGGFWCQMRAKKCNLCFPPSILKAWMSPKSCPMCHFQSFSCPFGRPQGFPRISWLILQVQGPVCCIIERKHSHLPHGSVTLEDFFSPLHHFSGVKANPATSTLPRKDVPLVRHSLPWAASLHCAAECPPEARQLHPFTSTLLIIWGISTSQPPEAFCPPWGV